MISDVAYLLLPVAAASGWLAARKHFAARAAVAEMDGLRRACRTSLDYLIRENPERAVQLLGEVFDGPGESFNAHMALAAIARKEGQVERAIALHQNLLARSGLKDEEREHVLVELGIDYRRAGLFDRAEEVFTGLLDLPRQRDAALVQLLDIYQQEKEWQKAVECLRSMGGRGSRGESLAQFHCELVQEKKQAGLLREAQIHLQQALAEDPNCVRASLLGAELAMASGDFAQAYRCLKRVEDENPAFLSEVFPVILCHGERLAERRELLGYLDWIAARHNSADAAITQAHLISRSEGAEKALDYLAAAVAARPSLRGLNALLKLLCEMPAPSSHLFVVRQSLQRFQLNTPSYRCGQCGFGSEALYWRCPACRHWESQRPTQDPMIG